MNRRCLALVCTVLVLASCQHVTGSPLVVSDVRIFAPITANGAGVAYLTIENRGDATVRIVGARSRQFSSVELHETTIENGVSRMRPLDELLILAGERIAFESGGKHIMLMGAGSNVSSGSSITLELVHDRGQLSMSAIMQTR